MKKQFLNADQQPPMKSTQRDLQQTPNDQDIRPVSLLEGVRFDHTKADLSLTPEKTELPIARLWVTFKTCRSCNSIINLRLARLSHIEAEV